MRALPLPAGMRNVTPYLVVDDPDALIAFCRDVFGAQLVERMASGETAQHAEVRIGDSLIMIGNARGGAGFPAMLYVYVDDCDAVYARALECGAEAIAPLADMYYGDRHGGVRDRFGNSWWIATHVEDVAPQELQRRHDEEQRRRAAASTATA